MFINSLGLQSELFKMECDGWQQFFHVENEKGQMMKILNY